MGVFAATIAKAVPLMLAAVGGVISERAGVINFALEGMMLSGAFAAVWTSHETGSPWLGLAAAVVAGMAVGVIHAVASLYLRVNQIVSAIALNLLALGATGSLLWKIFNAGTSPEVPTLPSINVSGHAMNALVPLALIAPPAVWAFLRYTVWGLHLLATGEDVEAARAAGVRVVRVKFAAVIVSGAFAGAAGAYLSIGILSSFTLRMTGGRGYMAIAAVIFGKWHPLGAAVAALLFGFFEALSETLAGRLPLPPEAFHALPYILTLVALAGFVGKARAPRALGRLPEEA